MLQTTGSCLHAQRQIFLMVSVKNCQLMEEIVWVEGERFRFEKDRFLSRPKIHLHPEQPVTNKFHQLTKTTNEERKGPEKCIQDGRVFSTFASKSKSFRYKKEEEEEEDGRLHQLQKL